jgi:hypothetical protein
MGCLDQWFSNFSSHHNHHGEIVRSRLLGSGQTYRISDSMGLGHRPRIYISNKFPDDVGMASLWDDTLQVIDMGHFETLWCWTSQGHYLYHCM